MNESRHVCLDLECFPSLCWMGAELMDEGVHKRPPIIPKSGMGGTGEEGDEKLI